MRERECAIGKLDRVMGGWPYEASRTARAASSAADTFPQEGAEKGWQSAKR